MKTIVPFTKEINLESKVAEITSISLEHETEINDGSLTGDFIISGNYKAHEISVNKEPFEFRLPFIVDLGNKIERESVNFDILDFTYDLKDSNTLKVDIEFSVEAEDVPEIIEEEISADDEIRLEEEITEFIEKEEPIEDIVEERKIDEISQDTILNTLSTEEETYKTYHIHIVKENETLESICTIYNVDTDYLKEYNNLDEITIGDKLLVPDEVNE